MGNSWLSREGRGGRSGVLATNSLYFPSTRPYVSPGRCLGSRPVSGGCWLGPEELLLGGSRAHAACLPHAHDPLSAYREQKEERQGWDTPSDLPAPSLVLIPTHPLLYFLLCFPRGSSSLIPSLLFSLRYVLLSLLLLSQPGRQLRQSLLCHWHRPPVWDHDI